MARATMTLQQLEKHLWNAANILCGSVDSDSYKRYIVGLLFQKKSCMRLFLDVSGCARVEAQIVSAKFDVIKWTFTYFVTIMLTIIGLCFKN